MVPPGYLYCSRSRSAGPVAPAETLAWTLACLGADPARAGQRGGAYGASAGTRTGLRHTPREGGFEGAAVADHPGCGVGPPGHRPRRDRMRGRLRGDRGVVGFEGRVADGELDDLAQ